MAVTRIAEHAEQAGFDVFAFGEDRNPPLFASSPPTVLGYIATRTQRIMVST